MDPRSAACAALALWAVACAEGGAVERALPSLVGFGTMLVQYADRIDVHDLTADPDPGFVWHAERESDALRLALFDGTPDDLELTVTEAGALVTRSAGVPLPVPRAAHRIDAEGALTADETAPWAERVRLPRRGCEVRTFSSIQVPGPVLVGMVPALDGTAIIAVGDDVDGRRTAFAIGERSVQVISTTARGVFRGADGAPWLIEPWALVRLDVDLEIEEEVRIPTDLRRVIDAVESRDGPRFYLLDDLGFIHRWSDAGEPTFVPQPFSTLLRPGQLQLRRDGELWASHANAFARYRDDGSGRWQVETLGAEVPSASSIHDTRSFGTLLGLVQRSSTGAPVASLYVREGDAWQERVPVGLLQSNAWVESEGMLYGGTSREIVEVHLGAAERATSVCTVSTIHPAVTRMIATDYGIFVYARGPLASVIGWLTRR